MGGAPDHAFETHFAQRHPVQSNSLEHRQVQFISGADLLMCVLASALGMPLLAAGLVSETGTTSAIGSSEGAPRWEDVMALGIYPSHVHSCTLRSAARVLVRGELCAGKVATCAIKCH